jgi:hypothetical protein
VPPADRKPVTAVLAGAIATRDGQSVLFLLADGKAVQTPVTVGRKVGELVQISGAKPGDKAILKPAAGLRDGQPVRPAGKP